MHALLRRSQGDWPFPARRSPFYYGWVIAAVSTLGFIMSIPGQTMGMAVFADAFMEAFGLSRTELSTAYLLGTTGSALFLTQAGRLFDRWGARALTVLSALLLGTALLAISTFDHLIAALTEATGLPPLPVAFVLMLLGFFAIRFSGQGVLTSASRNVLLLWFQRRRGLISGVRGVFVSFAFASAPAALALLTGAVGWRGALWVLAALVGGAFALLAAVTLRDRPEACGLAVDGGPPAPAGPEGDAAPSPTSPSDGKPSALGAVRRSPLFWVYASALALHAFFGTAVTFHVAALFEEAGRTRAEAFAYFLPQAGISVVVNLLASAWADRSALKPVLLLMLGAFFLGALGVLGLASPLGYGALLLGFGVGGGLWGVLSNLAFVRLFGTAALGEISGLNTALSVFASALGPLAFALAQDTFGTLGSAAYGCAALSAALWFWALRLPQPEDRPDS
jgi:MFS family permease